MQEQPASVGGRPAVGNVLGFSLLLRDRQALLHLERRALTPGVRLHDYEAEVPDVVFPLRAQGASAFRRRRCRVRRLGLEVEPRALVSWLRERLLGSSLCGLRIDEVDLDLAGEVEPDLPRSPCLYLGGRRDGQRGWVMLALQVLPQGRCLALRPWRRWKIDQGAPPCATLWREIAARLGGRAHDDDDTFVFDPVHPVLLRSFVSAGWRVPDFGDLVIADVALRPERAELSLVRRAEGAAAGPTPATIPPVPDPVRQHLVEVEDALTRAEHQTAAAQLERLADRLSPEHPARLAILRWLVRLARADDPALALRALRAWLHLRPRDDEAARALVLAQGRAGNDRGLAQRLAAECRLPHAPVRQARLELALAVVLVDRLGDPQSGRGLLEPLLDRCVGDPALAPVERSVRACLARALAASDPSAAVSQLEQALSLTERSATRASLRAALARALARSHHHAASLPQWTQALSVAPDDLEWVDAALASMRAVGALDQEIELLRTAIGHATPADALGKRRELVAALVQRDDPTSRELARVELRALVRDEPHSRELALQLSNLEHDGGQPERAATLLRTLIDDTEDPGDRVRLRLELARVLTDTEQPQRAWTDLQPALEEVPPALEAELLEHAIEIAPASARDALVDRLAEIDHGPRSGRALLTRAHARVSDSRRREDLRAAAQRLDDPRAALRELTALTEPAEFEVWNALADACAAHSDVEGEASARVELALRLLTTEQEQDAVAAFARAHALRPDDTGLALTRGWLDLQAQRDADAIEHLLPLFGALPIDTAPANDPRLKLPSPAVLQARLGRALVREGRPEEAIDPLVLATAEFPIEEDPTATETLFEALEAVGRRAEASATARRLADASEGTARARWLRLASRHAEPADALQWLGEAATLQPDDLDLLTALELAARSVGDEARLDEALRRIGEHPEAPNPTRAHALRELVSRRRASTDDSADPSPTVLYEQLLALEPDDLEALLALWVAARESDDTPRALELSLRVLDLLPVADPRGDDARLWLARQSLDEGRPERAAEVLAPQLERQSLSPEGLELLAEAARRSSDTEARLRILRAIIAHVTQGPLRTEAHLQLARELGQRGRSQEGLEHAANAAHDSPPGSDSHIDAARTWLTLAVTADDPRQEAAARAELRGALGPELSAKELRAEAMLLAEQLSDAEGAQDLIEEGLARTPDDALLLSALKHLSQLRGDRRSYLVFLDAAVESLSPGDDRDRLGTELALASAEAGDALRAHRTLDRLSTAAAHTEILLDLRDWTVRNLGLEQQELLQVDEQLEAGPIDTGLLRRLELCVGEGEPMVEHLLSRSRDCESESIALRLIEPALALAEATAPASLWMRVLQHAMRVGASEAALEAWPSLVRRVAAEGEEGTIADLVSLTDDTEQAGFPIDDTVAELLDQSLANNPDSRHLHRALARRLARRNQEPTARDAELIAHLEMIAEHYEMPPAAQAELFVGMAERLDRRAAAELLTARAKRVLDERDAFDRLVLALEALQCWPEVLRLLTARVGASTDPRDEVATLKHLAHIAAEVLGDSETAVIHLESALERAPTDPDLLLPLLDHHFSQTDLSRAIELTERVLDHVRMGDTAYSALAHRAADAAIAQGELERATVLIERVTQRIPDDAKAVARLEELRSRADDPAHRVVLLAAVATRQSGTARIEALEERARLLLDPLERPLEAMEDLAAVVAESPKREHSTTLLADLYYQHARFDKLVALYETELPRHHGAARAEVLRKIATLQRDELYDLPRAEQALRLAIDQLDASPAQQDLADELHEELAANLERQGRFVDLAAYLQQQLAPQLASGPEAPAPATIRLALLQTLARLLRDRIDDEEGAARIYEHLERWDALSDDGLATLARWYRRSARHEDLVRVLLLRAKALTGHGERRAAVDLRIAEILDGPLSRPHDAAPHYLEAFLADPQLHATAGARARVLLSAVDSVVNVRDRLRARLDDLTPSQRPPLLTLLADILAPHEEHEADAEEHYREALRLAPELASAHEGLGRLLSRAGKHADAAEALVAATVHDGLSSERLAEAAALAARNLIELERFTEAEAVLRRVLTVTPESTRALLELARLYERSDRPTELSDVLDRLSGLPLSSSTLAEVAYRRALLLEPVYTVVPNGPQGERARSLLLEALGINPRHASARRALLSLATERREWSIVAHMHYLAIRDLAPGPQRAIAHLDLASIYLEHLDDPASAMRNIESALQQAATDLVVANRMAELARRVPDPRTAAERFEGIAAADNELADAARARLWLLAADLRLEDDDREAAEAASRRVLALPSVSEDATAAATRILERLAPRDPEHLAEDGSAVLARLEQRPEPEERARLLGRLHDIGVALRDPDLMRQAARGQTQLAAELDQSDEQASTTSALLRDLFAARGEYGPVVELYERLAGQTGGEDPLKATAVLVEAAGFAWRGQQEPASAASLLGRALRLRPDDEAALSTLAELIRETSSPELADEIHQALHAVDDLPQSPALSLLLATLASARGTEDEALALLRPLATPDVAPDVRFEAMGRLEGMLADRGEHDERRALMAELFALAREREDPRVGDFGVELARLHDAAGDRVAARHVAQTALALAAEHRDLLRLVARLAEDDEDWAALVTLHQQLAQLAVDDDEQATSLTLAARLLLAHPEVSTEQDTDATARSLLLRACEVAPQASEPRISLLPLAFRQARWDETLDRAEELTRLCGDDEEVLVLGALAEAYLRGERRLAREIGYRHSTEVARRLLLPGLQQTLAEVANRGPLPRLDALLAAGSALTGGRRHLFQSLHAWASERPPDAGLSLGLARLYEARGAGEMARHHYQLASFMAAGGPVPALVSRLPAPPPSDPELHLASTAPMESRSALRETLAALRDHLAGLGNEGAPRPAPPHAPPPQWWHAHMEFAETIVEPWRALLGVDLPMAWTDASLPGGIAVRNDRPPRVLLSSECAQLSRAEFVFRLAAATAAVALGTAVLEAGSLDLGVLLDAMGQLANPGHQPTGVRAQLMADVLNARDARNIGLTTPQRTSLANELAHWFTSDDGLARLGSSLRRSRLLLATRVSGRLDGALLAVARDHGLVQEGRIDAVETLRQDDADWLLRALLLR